MCVCMSTTVDFVVVVVAILRVVLSPTLLCCSFVVFLWGEVRSLVIECFCSRVSCLETVVSYAKQRKCSGRKKTYRLWTCQVKSLL